MEHNGKLRVRFNLFDALIILLALGVLAAAVVLRNRSVEGGVTHETTTMRYTVEWTRTPHNMAECIHVGDDAFRATDGAYLGTVAEFRAVPHVELEYSAAQGRYIRYESPDHDDIYITIEGQGYATVKDVTIGDIPVRVGMELPLKGKGYARIGYVVDMDTMDAVLPTTTDLGAGNLTADYVIRVEDARDFISANIHEGDHLYEAVTGAQLGVVKSFSVQPYTETRLGADGVARTVEKDGRSLVLIRLEGRCVEKNDGYYLDGATELKVGAATYFRSQYLERQFTFFELTSLE